MNNNNMNNNNDYTNEEYLNSKNKKEIANINSIGENIINDKNISPNGLGNNSLYKIRNQLNRPEIINDNRIINDDILSNDIIVNKKQIPIDAKNNIKIVIENIEPTEVTKELKNLSNKSNNYKSNNYKSNNYKSNNNSTIMIVLKELKDIFPVSVIIAIVIFVLILIYIVRF